MKKYALALFAVLAFGVGTFVVTYPKAGDLIYDTAIAVESTVYGLERRTQALDDLAMVYYRGGAKDAPAIVMVHGYTSDKSVWLRFARHFTASHHVIIPDLAGHGETAFDPALSYTQQAQAARIAALLDRLGIARAHIIGNSMGGYISAYFALSYPQRTLSAAMIDAAGVISPQPSAMDLLVARGENPFEIRSTEDFERFLPMTMAQPPYLPQVVIDAKAATYMARRERYATIFAAIHGEPRLTDRLPQLTPPSLLIWGDQDRLIDVSAVAVWQQQVPGISVAVMPGIGHMPMIEAPAQTAAIYREFLLAIALCRSPHEVTVLRDCSKVSPAMKSDKLGRS